jgi:hypothetical protein
MESLIYIVMGFGAVLALTGIALFARKGAEGTNTIKMFGFEFQLAGSALVIFVMGALIFLVPILYNEKFGGSNQSSVKTDRLPIDSGSSSTSKQQTPETRILTAPHAPKIEINQRYTVWEEQLMQFSLEPGESKVIKGGDLYARVATYPESSCAGPGFVPYTWQIRNPYPGGGDLEIRTVLMGGMTERVGLGSMGSGTMSVCDEHTFKNNGVERIYVELRYASAADLGR